MGSDLSRIINSCLIRESDCGLDLNCPNCEINGCCDCQNGSININSHIEDNITEDEEEIENEDKRRSNVRRRSSEN